MAIQITLPDGEEWRSGMNNIPVFPASTPEAFYELLLDSAPDPKTGKPDPEKMGVFVAAHPESANSISSCFTVILPLLVLMTAPTTAWMRFD